MDLKEVEEVIGRRAFVGVYGTGCEIKNGGALRLVLDLSPCIFKYNAGEIEGVCGSTLDVSTRGQDTRNAALHFAFLELIALLDDNHGPVLASQKMCELVERLCRKAREIAIDLSRRIVLFDF